MYSIIAQSDIVDQGAEVLIGNGLPGVIILVLIAFCVFMGRHILSHSTKVLDEHKKDREAWKENIEELKDLFNEYHADHLSLINEWADRFIHYQNKNK